MNLLRYLLYCACVMMFGSQIALAERAAYPSSTEQVGRIVIACSFSVFDSGGLLTGAIDDVELPITRCGHYLQIGSSCDGSVFHVLRETDLSSSFPHSIYFWTHKVSNFGNASLFGKSGFWMEFPQLEVILDATYSSSIYMVAALENPTVRLKEVHDTTAKKLRVTSEGSRDGASTQLHCTFDFRK